MCAAWQTGRIVADRYRLEAEIGAGGAGQVFRAVDLKLEAPVAIKLLDPRFEGSPVAARFLREARATAQIRSLHVVQILDHGQHDRTAYITMELLEGETLADRLDRVGVLDVPSAARVMQAVVKATVKAHDAGIIHRDIKPGNVFLVAGEDAEDEVVKVFDFGIAKILQDDGSPRTGATKAGTLLGTPGYMSPEQAAGRAVDYRSDLYSLGILAFECLTGRVPFDTDDLGEMLGMAVSGELLVPSAVAPVPNGFDAWFARATSLEPEHRFGSARSLGLELRAVLGG